MTDAGSDWRTLLRHERRQLHVTQDRLARAVHLSPETIRKYENGQRTPTRDSLVRILEILQVPAARGREILSSAGFAVPARMLPAEQHADYFFTADEAHVEIERTPWPQFVVTRAMDIVAVNRAARLLWGVDVERSSRRPPQLHLLALLAEPQFASRVVNFEECLRIVIGLIEGNLFKATTTDDSNLWVDAVFGQLADPDPAAVARLIRASEPSRPFHVRTRNTYPLVWREPEGEIRFLGATSTSSEPDGLAFHDWVPADAASHVLLEQVLAGRSSMSGGGGSSGRSHPGPARRRSSARHRLHRVVHAVGGGANPIVPVLARTGAAP